MTAAFCIHSNTEPKPSFIFSSKEIIKGCIFTDKTLAKSLWACNTLVLTVTTYTGRNTSDGLLGCRPVSKLRLLEVMHSIIEVLTLSYAKFGTVKLQSTGRSNGHFTIASLMASFSLHIIRFTLCFIKPNSCMLNSFIPSKIAFAILLLVIAEYLHDLR